MGVPKALRFLEPIEIGGNWWVSPNDPSKKLVGVPKAPVRLVPAQHVKPFVKGPNKNDAGDALVICETEIDGCPKSCPGVRPCWAHQKKRDRRSGLFLPLLRLFD